MGVDGGLIEKSGSWLLYNGERLGQGRDNAKATLQGAPKLADEIEKALRAKYLSVPAAPEAVRPEVQPEPEPKLEPKAEAASASLKAHRKAHA